MGTKKYREIGDLVDKKHMIFRNTHAAVFASPRPLVPGHLVVAFPRNKKRLHDLTKEECKDLFSAIRSVISFVEGDSDALTLYLQDGASAGQSIDQVHMHIVPRKKLDALRNEDIYNHGSLTVEGDEEASLLIPDDFKEKMASLRLHLERNLC